MNKTIVTIPSSDIRKLGRQALCGHWKTAVLAVLLVNLITQVPSLMITALFPSGANFSVSSFYVFLVSGPLTMGMMMVFLNLFRGKQTSPIEVFYGFEYLLKTFGIYLVTWAFTVLWTFAFIIPGFIAAYRYSLAYYILADDPTKGVMQCINESKVLMAGNKWKAFCLDFSFIGWSLLCSIPVGIFAGITVGSVGAETSGPSAIASMQMDPTNKAIMDILTIGLLWLHSYMYTSSACLYDMINGNLTVKRVIRTGEETYSATTPQMPIMAEAEVVCTEDEETEKSEPQETEPEAELTQEPETAPTQEPETAPTQEPEAAVSQESTEK